MSNRDIMFGNLEKFLMNNVEAVNFCIDLWDVIQVWDDLIDKDKDVSNDDINNIFRKCLFDIQLNGFYSTYKTHLTPLIMNCILQWEDSNKMEKSKDTNEVSQSWMLRASYYQIVSYCAYLVGGIEWSRKIGVEIRNSYGERLDDFIKEAI